MQNFFSRSDVQNQLQTFGLSTDSAKQRVPPAVLIESVTADQQRLQVPEGTRLPPLTGNIQIDYTALSFTAPEKVRFRYRMEGFDTE